MPASVINRFPTSTLRPDGVTGINKQNEMMERISRRARRLSSHVKSDFTIPFNMVGRNDSLEQLVVRLGVIPISTYPTASSLTGLIQAPAGRRPAGTETVSVAGPTAPAAFVAGGAAQAAAFTAGGNGQVLTATDSVDAAAKGRALVDILP